MDELNYRNYGEISKRKNRNIYMNIGHNVGRNTDKKMGIINKPLELYFVYIFYLPATCNRAAMVKCHHFD